MTFYEESHPFTLTFEFLDVYAIQPTSYTYTNLTCVLVGAFLLAIPLGKNDIMYMNLIQRKFSPFGMFFMSMLFLFLPHHSRINLIMLLYSYHLMKSQPLCSQPWLTLLILHHFPQLNPHPLWKFPFLLNAYQFHHQISPFFTTLIDIPKPLLISRITKSTIPCCLPKEQSLIPRPIHGTLSISMLL